MWRVARAVREKICDTIDISIDTYVEQQRWGLYLGMDVTCSRSGEEESFTRKAYIDLTKARKPEILEARINSELSRLWFTVAHKVKHITYGEIDLVEEKGRCLFEK